MCAEPSYITYVVVLDNPHVSQKSEWIGGLMMDRKLGKLIKQRRSPKSL